MEVGSGDGVQTSMALAVADRSPPRNQWKKKYLILKRKCDQIDQSNDVLYAKSRQIYKMIQRAETEKRVLMQRLEQYEVELEDSHVATRFKIPEIGSPPHSFPPSSLPSVFTSPTPDRSEPDLLQLKQDTVPASSKPHPPTLTSLPTETSTNHHPPPPSKRPHLSATPSSSTPPSNKPAKKTPKSSARSSNRRKKDTDSNAPKKPSNAFFWFCQEQRGSLEEQFRGEGVAGQHSLTKILAQKWGETSADDKKKYYLKYTDDKKRYEREMQAYQLKKQEQQEQMQQQLAALTATNTSTTT